MSKADRKRRSRCPERRVRLHFLGATETVTGSLHFFEIEDECQTVRFFLDAGLNQETPSRNYQNRLPSGVKASEIDFGIFSHAHIDHTGFFPRLVKDGFRGPVYATPATRDLIGLLLPDSGHLQEEEAERFNKRLAKQAAAKQEADKAAQGQQAADHQAEAKVGNGKQKPKSKFKQGAKKLAAADGVSLQIQKREPLYTEQDAVRSLMHVKALDFNQALTVAEGVVLRFTPASHLLGAAVVTLELGTGGKKRRVVFSGDLGRPNMPILQELEPVLRADYLICEGTYGNKRHAQRDRLTKVEETLKQALERANRPAGKRGENNGAGVIVMAAFAIGRVQSLLYDLRILMKSGRLPNVPVYVDGRMANNATAIHREYPQLYNSEASAQLKDGADLFSPPRYEEVREWTHSLKLDEPSNEPRIIISSSGMAAGGRILRHLEKRLPCSANTIVFCGFQSPGTLGRQLVERQGSTVYLNGKKVAVRATVEHIVDYSGHADYEDILRWMKHFQNKPTKVFLVHGELESLEALKQRIEERLRWDVQVPKCREFIDIE